VNTPHEHISGMTRSHTNELQILYSKSMRNEIMLHHKLPETQNPKKTHMNPRSTYIYDYITQKRYNIFKKYGKPMITNNLHVGKINKNINKMKLTSNPHSLLNYM
jgi:hypothetical protein